MPKKTKREKILAELHRSQTPTVPHPFVPDATGPETPSPAPAPYQWRAAHSPLQPAPTLAFADQQQYHAIKQDLVKTILLSAGAIAIELLLYTNIGR